MSPTIEQLYTSRCAVMLTIVILTVVGIACGHGDTSSLPTDVQVLDIFMKNATPVRDDEYLCSAHKVPVDEGYVVQYEAKADASLAHHILLFGCTTPYSTADKWHCGGVCKGDEQIIFAWAKNAPPLHLPKDVGFHIGGSTSIKYIVVQVHYAKKFPAGASPDNSGIQLYITRERQKFVAGIYLMLAYEADIPANTEKYHANISCKFDFPTSIFPFGYRTHAHVLMTAINGFSYLFHGNLPVSCSCYERSSYWGPICTVISGYTMDKTSHDFTMIGKGNPQWPQSFYPVKKAIEIKPGDYMFAQCTYSSVGRNRVTHIGSTADDEMCNFYTMYYMDGKHDAEFGTCGGNRYSQLFKQIPSGSDVPLPPDPLLEEAAEGHHHHHAMHGSGEGHDELAKTTVAAVVKSSDISHGKTVSSNKGSGNINSKSEYLNGRQRQSTFRKPFMFPDYVPEYPINDYYNDMSLPGAGMGYRKPQYDLYGDRDDGGFNSGFDSDGSTLSRNRNKLFDAMSRQYLDYTNDLGQTGYSDMDRGSDLGQTGYSDMDRGSEFGVNSAMKLNKDTGKKGGPNILTQVNKKMNLKGDLSSMNRGSSSGGTAVNESLELKFISAIPQPSSIQFGQVAGIAANADGDLYVFHRGHRVWNSESFNLNNEFRQKHVPISEKTVVVFDKDGNVKKSFGENMFYMPHGITVDQDGNIWLTDVGLHQVFRISRDGTSPDITLGKRFEPGSDGEHFCKPSDVAVMSNGNFFVSDGYCNNRIIKFSKSLKILKQWGKRTPYNFNSQGDTYPDAEMLNVPHSLALAEDLGLLCVADRENGRITCFDLDGKFVRQIHPREFGTRLFAVEFCPQHGGLLFAVNGPSYGGSSIVQGFTIDIKTGNTISTWNIPAGMKNPHDVTVDSRHHMVYVGELNPTKVWRFQMQEYKQPGKITTPVTSDNSAPSTTPAVVANHSNSNEIVVQDVGKAEKSDGSKEDLTPSIIIGSLLVVPVVLLIVITVLIRLYHSGKLGSFSRRKRGQKKFNLGNFLNSHKGFDRLSTEESDHEIDDVLDDSDHEEFSITRKA